MTPAHHHSTNRPGIRALIACLVFGIGVYILVVMAAYHAQTAIIFKTGGLADTPPAGIRIATVSIPSDHGLHLNGWWLETPGAQRTVLYFQGNRRQAADHLERFDRHPCFRQQLRRHLDRLTGLPKASARLP